MSDQLSDKEIATLRHIRNWIVHQGRTPSVRELMNVLDYKSPRSAALIVNRLIELGLVRRRESGELQLLNSSGNEFIDAQTVDVPLVGAVSCGTPMLAEENVEGFIPVSTSLARPGSRHFLLRATGDSMNKTGIDDGDLVLVRQQQAAEEGDKVVALVDGEATIKEYHREKGVIILMPRSTNRDHKPIILAEDFQVQGIVVTAIPNPESLMANYHVSKDKESGDWRITKEGAERVSDLASTQAKAEKIAKDLAANSGGGEVRIHDLKGKIRDSDTVPPAHDPNPPKDLKH